MVLCVLTECYSLMGCVARSLAEQHSYNTYTVSSVQSALPCLFCSFSHKRTHQIEDKQCPHSSVEFSSRPKTREKPRTDTTGYRLRIADGFPRPHWSPSTWHKLSNHLPLPTKKSDNFRWKSMHTALKLPIFVGQSSYTNILCK